jgi:protein TonB
MRDAQFLAQSLVEGDAARVRRFRRLRRKALLFSVVGETMIIAALLLAPLASPETLTRRHDWTPIPPYGSKPVAPDKPSLRHLAPIHVIDHYARPTVQPSKIPQSAPQPDASDESHSGSYWGSETGSSQEGIIGLPPGEGPRPVMPPPDVPKPPKTHPPIIRRSEMDPASLIHHVMPVYPPLAAQTRTEGEVKLHAIIAIDGTIQSLEVVSGPPLLIQAARDAVRQWRYKPAVLNGQPVEVDTFINVIFRLER